MYYTHSNLRKSATELHSFLCLETTKPCIVIRMAVLPAIESDEP